MWIARCSFEFEMLQGDFEDVLENLDPLGDPGGILRPMAFTSHSFRPKGGSPTPFVPELMFFGGKENKDVKSRFPYYPQKMNVYTWTRPYQWRSDKFAHLRPKRRVDRTSVFKGFLRHYGQRGSTLWKMLGNHWILGIFL